MPQARPASSAREQTITITASDGYRLAATVFEPAIAGPAGAGDPVTIISSAAAVPRGYYGPFARALADRGRTVLTYDYRGIGGSRGASLRGSPIHMRDWGQLDAPALLTHARNCHPDRPIHWIGQSYGGGFAVGLNPLNHHIDRHLGIAVPHGYWREMTGIGRIQAGVVMGVVLPVMSHVFGYMPGRATGLGEDLPKQAALEWRSWILSRNSMWGTLHPDALAPYQHFSAPMCFIRLSDDDWATETAGQRIAHAFPAARERHVIRLTPTDAGGPIGHIGFFRARHRDTLWPKAFAWLEGTHAA
jgi:predicted alpha/beta hydrolase